MLRLPLVYFIDGRVYCCHHDTNLVPIGDVKRYLLSKGLVVRNE